MIGWMVFYSLPSDTILDWAKLKAFANDKLNVKQGRKHCGNQHFLLFPPFYAPSVCCNFHTIQVTKPISGMHKAFHNTQLTRVISSSSRLNIKVTFLKKMAVSGALVFHKHKQLLVTSNISFAHSVFYPFGELSEIFIKFKVVVCEPFHFGRV